MNSLGKQVAEMSVGFEEEIAEMLVEAAAAKAAWVQQLGVMAQSGISKDQREILRQIRMDDAKHLRILEDILRVKGKSAAARIQAEKVTVSTIQPPSLKKAAALKLRSAEFTRKLYQNSPHSQPILEILQDDTNNAIRLCLME